MFAQLYKQTNKQTNKQTLQSLVYVDVVVITYLDKKSLICKLPILLEKHFSWVQSYPKTTIRLFILIAEIQSS